MTRAVLVAAFAALPVLAPAAQPQMRPDARPTSGTIRPGADRPAEIVDLTARTVAPTGMEDCPGYVDPSAPDVVVDWSGGDLRMTVRASFDATLAVSGPDGTWSCNDDSDGLMPVVEQMGAPRGRYAVWVGSLQEDPEDRAATLIAGRPAQAATPNASARPTSGTVRVEAGFEAQSGAVTRDVRAGGIDAAMSMGLQSANVMDVCTGFVDSAAPTAVVAYEPAQAGGDGQGTLVLSAASADTQMPTDLVLLVRTPEGAWRCNDDYGSSDPVVVVEGATRGDYAVWAGTYSSHARTSTVAATLSVSETAPPPPDMGMDGMEDMEGMSRTPFSEGTYMPLQIDGRPAVRLAVGDAPASATTDVLAEGRNPVAGDVCSGYVTAAPTAAVEMSGSGPFGVTAVAADGSDLVLLVQTPSGAWFCSDDADGLNPGVQFGTADDPTAEAGTYRVWVGTFADPNGMSDMEGMEEMPAVGPTSVTVTAARGEIVVTQPDMGMGMDLPDFMEGTYEGTDLRPDDALTTLTLRDGAATAQVTAGGALINPVDGDVCAGFVDARPTLAFTAEGSPLSVTAAATDDDLVMLVRTPSGQWLCSDDADGSSPRVQTSEQGRYAVWVGTFSRRPEGVPADVTIASAMMEMGE